MFKINDVKLTGLKDLYWDHYCSLYILMILTVVLLIGYLNLQMTLNWWAVYSEEEIEQFRLDIKRLYDWSVDWQMRFNTEEEEEESAMI